MKILRFFLTVVTLIDFLAADAQVTTNGGSGLSASYNTLDEAITALNAATITSPVILTVNNNEIAPQGGYVITAEGTASNQIIIQGNSASITANNSLSTGNLADGIFKLVGADYVTLTGFIITENPANTVASAGNNNMTEWGVAVLYGNAINGAQHNSITDNLIDLDRSYANTFGIYSNSTHSAAAPLATASATGVNGGNHDLKIYGNNITDVNTAVVVIGPLASADFNNGLDIGGTSNITANNITNFGTTGSISAYANLSSSNVSGIIVRNTINYNVSYNRISSSAGGTTSGTLRGIYIQAFNSTPAGVFTDSICNNRISLQTANSAGSMYGINVESNSTSSSATLNINRNDFSNSTHTVPATGIIYFIWNAAPALLTNINSNSFTNLSVNTSGSVTIINNNATRPANAVCNVNYNQIISSFTKSAAGGNVIGYFSNGTTPPSSIENNIGNNFSNIHGTDGTTIIGWQSTDGPTTSPFGPVKNIINNTLTNFNTGLSGITGLMVAYSNTAGNSNVSGNNIANFTGAAAVTGISSQSGSHNFSGNTISQLQSTVTGTVSGITITGGASQNIINNKIYSLTHDQPAGQVNGILISGGNSYNLYNNIIGDLNTPAANGANPLNGINITSAVTVNLFHNTVSLQSANSSTLFGSSAVSINTTSNVTLRNNIFKNVSVTNGSGYTVAYRRSSTNLTTYNNASNNNIFYAGTPDSKHLIFHDGTNSDSMILAYKNRVGPVREAASATENVIFLSNSGNHPAFLHVDPTVPTQCESGGAYISAVATDFDNEARNTSTPDIGADEFDGIPADVSPPTITYGALSNTCTAGARSLLALIYDPSGVPSSGNGLPVLYWKINGGNYSPAQGTLVGGSLYQFSFGNNTAIGDTVSYFIVAQDLAGNPNVTSMPFIGAAGFNSNPPSAATPPATPYFYVINPTISGVKTVGANGNYATLSKAIEAYNNSCLTGPLEFVLTDQHYNLPAADTIRFNPTASPVNTLMIHPNTATAVTITGNSGSVPSALLRLLGAKFVTFDGIDSGGASLTIENVSIAEGSAVFWLSSYGANHGASSNIIRKVHIRGGVSQQTSTTNTFGIVLSGETLSTTVNDITAGNDNDNNLIDSNTFTRLRYGIYDRGGSASNRNLGNVIQRNIFGPASFDPDVIGKSAIVAREEDGIRITGNKIQFIGGDHMSTTSGSDRVAISLAGDAVWPSTAVSMKNAVITNNVIDHVIDERGFSAVGISLSADTTNNSTRNLIANNMISNVRAAGTGEDRGIGIAINAGNGDSILHNTIYMSGDTDPIATGTVTANSSFGISITSSLVSNPLIKNNIAFVDLHSSSNNAVNNAVINVPAGFAWGTGRSNYNDFFAGSNSHSFTGCSGQSTFFQTLIQWQEASMQDSSSRSVLPVFVSANNLHLVPSANSILSKKGDAAGIFSDIDGDTRSAAAAPNGPDMGADEFVPVAGVDISVLRLGKPVIKSCYSDTETVSVMLRNNSIMQHDFAAHPVTITVNVTGQANATFTNTINAGSLPSDSVMQVDFTGVLDMTSTGTYVFNASASAASDIYLPNNTMPSENRTVSAVIAGTISTDHSAYCVTGGTPMLTISGNSGDHVQWQEAADSNGTWTNVGTNSNVYTPVNPIASTTYYRAIAGCGLRFDTTNTLVVTVVDPQVLNTYDAGRCNPGTLTLQATGATGTDLHWYTAATGGGVQGVGNSFSTPFINSTTTFYVAAAIGSCESSRIPVIATIDPNENTWTGAISTAWEDTGNWSCGTIPGPTTRVKLNNGAVVVISSNAFVGTLIANPGASVTVKDGFNFTVVQ